MLADMKKTMTLAGAAAALLATTVFTAGQALAADVSFFSHSFSFILWSTGTATSTILQILFFL